MRDRAIGVGDVWYDAPGPYVVLVIVVSDAAAEVVYLAGSISRNNARSTWTTSAARLTSLGWRRSG